MNSSPAIDAFLTCVRKSLLVAPETLSEFLDRLRTGEGIPTEPLVMAKKMLTEGILTKFQAEQLLQNRSKNFVLAGKYKILERISSGQMSTVFLCEHVVMKRMVALKMLPAEKAKDPASLTRFHREARAAARLQHPNVVAIYDLDSGNGFNFLVSEYVNGSDLEHVVAASGPMPIGRAAECIRQAAEGLQHAHEMGMVHRDIKPGNLLLDRSGTVKLLDLGLARLFLDESDGMTKLDDGRMLLGTIDYLSPEQAQDSHEVDIRADIYSLGATAYFLLSGRTLFDGASTAQKLVMHGHRPAQQIVRSLSGLPRGFAEILVKMLAKDPDDRYQTPAEVAEAMAPWTSDGLLSPSIAEMPKLCLASRRAVEQSRSKAIRIPARAATTTPVRASNSKASLVMDRWQSTKARAARMTRKQAIALGLAGFAALMLVIWSPWSGSGNELPAAEFPTSSSPVLASSSIPTTKESRVLESRPEKPSSAPLSQAEQDKLYSKANELGAANRGVEAGEILRRLMQEKNQGAWGWLRLTMLDLHSNNLVKYRQDCEEMIRQFGGTNDPGDAERVVKCCVIAPQPVALEQASAIAERVLAPDTGEFAFWSRTALGIVAIRKGAYNEALAHLTEANTLNTSNKLEAHCLNKAFLSVLQSRRKQPALARAAYDEALKIMRDETEKGDSVDYTYEWHNWYACGIALKEAEALLKFPPK